MNEHFFRLVEFLSAVTEVEFFLLFRPETAQTELTEYFFERHY